MAFPVDNLTNVDYESLQQAAEEYMSQLPFRAPGNLVLPNSKQVKIGLCNVIYVPLYGTDAKKKLLALFSPDESVIGLYLLGKWWGVEDVLKTADPSRTGLIKVSTLGERIVLYVLNRIVLRNEKSSEDAFFLCHGEHESAKILWKDGEAIGFYSFKPKGSLCRIFVTQCYQLPVMDTAFVRKCHRGKGHGIKILEDFVGSFRNENTGLKFPLSEAMYKVCEKYLRIYPADKEFLWEVENTGGHFQRTLIANRLQTLKLLEKDHVVSKLNFEEEVAASMEVQITKIQETNDSTMEIVEETITDITKEVDDIPVTSRGRSSNLKRRGIRENSEERLSKTIIRVEDIEAGVENPIEATTLDSTFSVKTSENVTRITTDTVTRVSHLTTSEEIKSQNAEFQVFMEHTVEIKGACTGCIDQSQLQSVVDVEIVKMSTGNDVKQHENLENSKKVDEDKYVSEIEKGKIKQILDEPAGENTIIEATETFNSTETMEEMTEQSGRHAKPSEKEQVYRDVEVTEKNQRAENEVMEEHKKNLIEENRNENMDTEKCEAKDDHVALQRSVQVKGQTEMEVHVTEEFLCQQHNQSKAETEVSEPNQIKTTQSKMTQKRTSAVTPSRSSKRLRHEPVETDITTKFIKTAQQRSKQYRKAVIHEEESEEPVNEPDHDRFEVIKESSVEHMAETETGATDVTVETVSTMDNQIKLVEKTLEIVPERAERDHGETPQHSFGKPPAEVQESETTIEELEERMDYSTMTLSEAKVVLADSHKLSPKEADDNHGEMDGVEQDELNDTVSFEQQTVEGTLRVGSMEELVTTSEANIIAEQSTTYEAQENKPELKTPDGTVLSEDEKAENKQDSHEGDKLHPKQEKQNKTKGLTDIPRRSTRHKDQPVDPGVTPVRRSTRGKEVFQKVKYVEPQSKAKCTAKESLEVNEVIAVNVRPEESEMANTSVHETSSELVKATGTYDKEKAHEIAATTEVDILPAEAENDDATEKGVKEIKKTEGKETNSTGEMDKDLEMRSLAEATEGDILTAKAENDDATEKAVEEIKKTEGKETNSTGEMDRNIEMSSLAQAKDILEKEAPVSTEKSLRSRTINVTSTPRKKSDRLQKQVDVDIEHQESENKTEIISMTEDRLEVMDEDVKKMGNKEAMLAELEPVEETDISTNECEKNSVNVCIPNSTTEISLESLDKTSYKNVDETTIVETKSCEILIGVQDDQEKIVEGSEEEVSSVEAEPDEEIEKEDSTPVMQLQKATVLLVDLNQLSQNREDEREKEEQLKLDGTKRSEKESEEDEQKKQQTDEDSENIHEEEQMEDTVVKDDEQLLTEDQNKDENVHILCQEKAVQENLEEAPVSTERSLRQRTIKVQSTSKRKSRRMQKQKAETWQDATEIVLITEKRADEVGIDDKEKAPEKLPVKGTEKGIHEEDVAEKNKMNNETNLVGIKDTNEEVLPMREEAKPEQQEHHPLAKNEKETAGTEKPMEDDPVVSKKQANIIQVEEEVSEVEFIEHDQSLGLSKKAGTSTQKTRKSTLLHEVASESEKEVDVRRDEYEETLETTEETVNISAITIETNLGSLDEIANKNVEESPDISEILLDVEIDDKENAPQIMEEVPHKEAEPDEGAEKNDDTAVTILQNVTVVLVDIHKLSQNTEGESDSTEVPTHSQTEEKMDVDKSAYSEHQLCIVRSDEKELQTDTKKIPESGRSEPNKHEVTFEGQKPTEESEGQINVIEAEMCCLEHKATESVQEILEEEAPLSIERSLRRRTMQIQSTPRKKSKRVEKQEAEAFDYKTSKVTVTRKGTEYPKKDLEEKDDKEKMPQTLNVEATDDEIPLVEEEPKECLAEKVIEEMNNVENKETHLVVTNTDEEALDMEEANLLQQGNEPLVINEKISTETETSIEMDPVVSKAHPYIVEGTPETAKEVLVEKAEPDGSIEKYDSDMTLVIQQQNATVMLVDLKKSSQNTGESYIPKAPAHSQTEETLEWDQLSNLTAEKEQQELLDEDKTKEGNVDGKQNKPDKQDQAFEKQKLTEDVEGQNNVMEREHPEATATADQSIIILVAEKDQDDDLKEKHVVSKAEMSSLAQKAAESAQEVLEEEAPVSFERSLRRRTIQIQSTPRKKSRRVEKKEAEAFEDKIVEVTGTRKGVDCPKKDLEEKDDKEKMPQSLNIEATDEEIPFVEEEPQEHIAEKVVEEMNNVQNRETNLVVTNTEEEAPDREDANLVQQENEQLVMNDKTTTEEETSLEMDPVVYKGRPHILDETAETVEEIPVEETEPDKSTVKHDSDMTLVIEQQSATVVSVDIMKYSHNTEGETDIPESLRQTEENLERDQLSNLTAEVEEQQKLHIDENIENTPRENKMEEEYIDKPELTFEGQKLTEDVEGQNYVVEREHPETTTMADKSNIIQEAERDQDDDLKEKHMVSKEEMSLAQKAAESVQDVLEEEAPVSIERSLRRRTIHIQSTPRKKLRHVEKQEAEASKGKIGKVPITGMVMHEITVKVDDKGKTLQKSIVDATNVIPLIEAEAGKCAGEKVAEEIDKMDTCEEAMVMKEAANLDQQESYQLAVNDKETAETEKPMEIDEDPVFSKAQRSVVEGTTIHLVEEVSQVKSTESNQSDHERITRRSLRLSAKSDTPALKTKKSKRLHNAGLELEKEADISVGKSEETLSTAEKTSLESLNKIVNISVIETPAVEFESFELPMGVEIDQEAPQTVKQVPLKEAEHDEGAKNYNTLVIQLQNATAVLVDLNKCSQSTEGESDSTEVPTHSQKEKNTELDKPIDSEHQQCVEGSEEKEQPKLHKEDDTEKAHEDKMDEHTVEEQNEPMTFEGQKIDVQSTKIVVEVIHDYVQEAVTFGGHSEATTTADNANLFQDTEKDQSIALKDKHTDSDAEINSLAHKATEAVQEILEEEATVSTERSLRRRTIQIQSTPRKKSKCVQKQEAEAFEDKTGKVLITGKAAKEMHQESSKIDYKEETLQKSTVEETSGISLVEVQPKDYAAKNAVKETNDMENKETNLGNEEAPETGREEAIFKQQENEQLTASETKKLIETDEASVVSKEQTCIIKETSLQSENNLSINEDTLSMRAETLEVFVPSITEEKVETNSDEQETGTSNEREKVDEALQDISTDKEEDKTSGLIKTTENEIQEILNVQEDEKLRENTHQEQEENIQDEGEIEIRSSSVEETVSQQEKTVFETYPDCKATAVEGNIALERTDQEALFITRRSLRSRTVMVQSTPIKISKRLHRLEVKSEKESKDKTSGNGNDSALPQSADDLNIIVEIEKDTLNAVESIDEFEKMEEKEPEEIIQVTTEEKGAEIGTRDDTVEKGEEIQETTDQEKTQDERDIQVPKKDEEEVFNVQDKEKPVQEIEYEGVADVKGSTSAVDRRTLRKRTTVEAATPKKSKRLCKQTHDEDSRQVKEAVMGLTKSVEVTFTTDNAEVFEASNLGEEIQEIQKNAEGTKPDKSGESQEEQKEDRVNKTQTDEYKKEENNKELEKTNETLAEVLEQHLEAEEHLESSANEGFTLELEAEESSDLENHKADEKSRVAIDTPFTCADKSGEGDENISDNDEKGLSNETHICQSSLATALARQKSMRLQILESKKMTNKSDSEGSEEQQTTKCQRKRKAITVLTPSRKSKRHPRAKHV